MKCSRCPRTQSVLRQAPGIPPVYYCCACYGCVAEPNHPGELCAAVRDYCMRR